MRSLTVITGPGIYLYRINVLPPPHVPLRNVRPHSPTQTHLPLSGPLTCCPQVQPGDGNHDGDPLSFITNTSKWRSVNPREQWFGWFWSAIVYAALATAILEPLKLAFFNAEYFGWVLARLGLVVT